MNNVMIDIETMSTSQNNAVVLSIGAVAFEVLPSGRYECAAPLNVLVDVVEQLMRGRHVDSGTQAWWTRQERAAQQSVLGCSRQPVDVALTSLSGYCRNLCGAGFRVWARGPQFDIVNLESLYEQVGMAPPWSYSNIRDVRTVAREFPVLREQPELDGLTAHSASDDCLMAIRDIAMRLPLTGE